MNDDILTIKEVEKEIGTTFNLVEQLDYRNDSYQYTVDMNTNLITGIRLARRSTLTPTKIFDLKGLTTLDLSLSKIEYLPPEIRKCTTLEKLNLYNTNIKFLPDEIIYLKKLRNINASMTPLQLLPDTLCELQNIEKLTLWGTKIRNLPDKIGDLKKLRRLDISGCTLKTLPESIVYLNIDFTETELDGIAIKNISIDDNQVLCAAKQGREALRAYFESEEYQSKDFFYEIKLILLGNGGAGKTCVANALLNNYFVPNQCKTEGIDILHYKLEIENKLSCIHIWDFGGQEIYHAMHTIFMSSGAIYVIVLNGRSDEKPDEWLQYITTFSPQSPVIIVVSHLDENPRADLNREYYLNNFDNIFDITKVSCKNWNTPDGNFDALICMIKKLVSKYQELYRINWKKEWIEIKKSLETTNTSYITEDNYIGLCEQYNICNFEEQTLLREKLHQLGIMLSYDVGSYNILNPEWITKCLSFIYSLNILQENCLTIKKEDFISAINRYNKEYTRDKCVFIINILIKFGLCYEKNNELFIPSLLQASLSNRIKEKYTDWYSFIMQYKFLPTIVFQKFIVIEYENIFRNVVWNSGAMLVIDGTQVVIIKTTNEIYIYISEDKKTKRRECLAIIRNIFHTIHREMRFEESSIKELIRFKEEGEVATYPYNDLKVLLEMGVESLPIPKFKKIYSVRDILGEYDNTCYKEAHIMSIYVNNGNVGSMGDNAHSEENVFLGNGSVKLTESDIQQLEDFLTYIKGCKNLDKEMCNQCSSALEEMINAEKTGDDCMKRNAKLQWAKVLKKIGKGFLKGLAIASDILTVGSTAFKYLF